MNTTLNRPYTASISQLQMPGLFIEICSQPHRAIGSLIAHLLEEKPGDSNMTDRFFSGYAARSAQREFNEDLEYPQAISEVRRSLDGDRRRPAYPVYRRIGEFIAHYFAQISGKSMKDNPSSRSTFSESDLRAIDDDLFKCIPSREMMQLLHWAVPYVNPDESGEMFSHKHNRVTVIASDSPPDNTHANLRALAWRKLELMLALP
jgi:hypothetical protein